MVVAFLDADHLRRNGQRELVKVIRLEDRTNVLSHSGAPRRHDQVRS